MNNKIIIILSFSFKETTRIHLIKISMTHNQNQNLFLYLLTNCISARLAQQTSSLDNEHFFLFSNFLINGLGNSSGNCWLEIVSLSTGPPEEVFI